ncbi:MAG: hypothetical protein ACI9SG_003017 [Maribacter sp.]|jgi:hypothetical protein
MNKPPINIKTLYVLLVIVVVIARWYLIYLNPVASIDGPWSHSLAFSTLNKSPFFNQFYQLHPSRFYGYLGTPFFWLFKGKYSIFILSEIVKICLCFVVYRGLRHISVSRFISTIITLLFFLDKTLMTMREELILGTVILVFYSYFLKRGKTVYITEAIISFVFLYLLHPIAAVFHAFIYVSLNIMSLKDVLRQVSRLTFTYIILALLFVVYFTLFTDFGQAQLYESQFRITVGLSQDHFVSFVRLSFPLFVTLVLVRLWCGKVKRYIISVSIMLLLISFVGGSYYHIYIIIYTLLDLFRIKHLKPFRGMRLLAMTAVVSVSIFLSIIHFYVLYNESKSYTETITEIFKSIDELEESKSKVYIANQFAVPLLQEDNTRMMLNGLPFFLWSNGNLEIGDVCLITEENEFENLKNSIFYERCDCDMLVSPTIGVYSLSSLYRRRVNQYGLWKCTVIK